MHVLIIDGHPDTGRLTTTLLDAYRAALAPGVTWTAIAVRDLLFHRVASTGERDERSWERDVMQVASEIDACDHLVIGFPLSAGSEPAALTALLSRVLLPGFAFRYRRESIFPVERRRGRSADLVVTMDARPVLLRRLFADAVGRRWRAKVREFVGIGRPVRILRFGPTRRGGPARNADRWLAAIGRAARSVPAATSARTPGETAEGAVLGALAGP